MPMTDHRYSNDTDIQKEARADVNISSIGHRSDKLVAELAELNERVARVCDFLDPRPNAGSSTKEPQAVQSCPLERINDALAHAGRIVSRINNQVETIERRVS